MEVDGAPEAAAALSAEDAAAHAEQQYVDELQKELNGRADADATAADEQPEVPEQAVKVQSITCRPVTGESIPHSRTQQWHHQFQLLEASCAFYRICLALHGQVGHVR